MKKLIVFIGITTIISTGQICFFYFLKLKGFYWYHIPLFLGSLLTTVPASTYLNNLFNNKT